MELSLDSPPPLLVRNYIRRPLVRMTHYVENLFNVSFDPKLDQGRLVT